MLRIFRIWLGIHGFLSYVSINAKGGGFSNYNYIWYLDMSLMSCIGYKLSLMKTYMFDFMKDNDSLHHTKVFQKKMLE